MVSMTHNASDAPRAARLMQENFLHWFHQRLAFRFLSCLPYTTSLKGTGALVLVLTWWTKAMNGEVWQQQQRSGPPPLTAPALTLTLPLLWRQLLLNIIYLFTIFFLYFILQHVSESFFKVTYLPGSNKYICRNERKVECGIGQPYFCRTGHVRSLPRSWTSRVLGIAGLLAFYKGIIF